MNMKKQRWLMFFWIALLILGCVSLHPANMTQATKTIQPTRQITPSPTLTFTHVPTITETLPSVPGYQKTCATVETIIPDGFLSEGAIIFSGDDDLYYSFLSNDNSPHLFSNRIGHFPLISPDNKVFANDFDQKGENGESKRFLELLSAEGKQVGLLQFGQDWRSPFYWLDPRRLVFFGEDDTMTVVDVFSGQTTVMDYSSPKLARHPDSYPLYDSTLTRMVYQRLDKVYGIANLVLKDLVTGKELWTSHELYDYFYWLRPVWSPDGSQFAAGVPWGVDYPNYQLYVVGRDGQEKHITNLQNPQAEIYGTNWSPNSRYISFWYGDILTVYDTTTEISTDYCLRTVDAVSTQAYWSPDSRQLVLSVDPESETDPVRLVMLDVSTGRAVEIAENSSPVGWMIVP
jgi:hypothetical protein